MHEAFLVAVRRRRTRAMCLWREEEDRKSGVAQREAKRDLQRRRYEQKVHKAELREEKKQGVFFWKRFAQREREEARRLKAREKEQRIPMAVLRRRGGRRRTGRRRGLAFL